MIRAAITIAALLSFNPALASTVKLSSSGICHDTTSSSYNRTKNFTPFNSLEACLDSGGRLPKNYSGHQAKKPNSNEYSRSQFGHGWADINGDCQNARAEALIAQSVAPVRFKTDKECLVVSGRWTSPFTGNTIYSASEIDIDHVVPLKWAWAHGADRWPQEQREAIANDQANLVAVEASLNRSKGAKGLDEWLPPANECQYILRFLRIKKTYGLQLSQSEAQSYQAIKAQYCG